MATLTRDALKQYCLRELGAPVLEINVDEEQLEDRIDEAIELWREYHYDGIEKVYLKQKVDAGVAAAYSTFTLNFVLECEKYPDLTFRDTYADQIKDKSIILPKF